MTLVRSCTIMGSELNESEADIYCSEHKEFYASCVGCQYLKYEVKEEEEQEIS